MESSNRYVQRPECREAERRGGREDVGGVGRRRGDGRGEQGGAEEEEVYISDAHEPVPKKVWSGKDTGRGGPTGDTRVSAHPRQGLLSTDLRGPALGKCGVIQDRRPPPAVPARQALRRLVRARARVSRIWIAFGEARPSQLLPRSSSVLMFDRPPQAYPQHKGPPSRSTSRSAHRRSRARVVPERRERGEERPSLWPAHRPPKPTLTHPPAAPRSNPDDHPPRHGTCTDPLSSSAAALTVSNPTRTSQAALEPRSIRPSWFP